MRDYKLAQQHCICQLTGVVRQALIHIWKNKDKILIMLKQAKIRLSQPHPDGWCLSVFLGLKLSPLEQMCVQTHHPVNQCAARWAKRTFILFGFFFADSKTCPSASSTMERLPSNLLQFIYRWIQIHTRFSLDSYQNTVTSHWDTALTSSECEKYNKQRSRSVDHPHALYICLCLDSELRWMIRVTW